MSNWKKSSLFAILILTMAFLMATSVFAGIAAPVITVGDGVSVTQKVSATIPTTFVATPFEINTAVRTSVPGVPIASTAAPGFIAVSRYLIPVATAIPGMVNKAVMSATVRTYAANNTADPSRYIGRMRI